MRWITLIAALFGLVPLAWAQPNQNQLLKQLKDGQAAQSMNASELAVLNDPLFQLALKTGPLPKNFAELVDRIQPTPDKRVLFVIDEHIVDPQPNGRRRAVIGFTGSHKGLVLSPNVMLSVSFDPNRIPDPPDFIEAWGWDDSRGRYNYYKFDATGGGLAWKFRGSSENADKLTPVQRADTCLACHINGAPLMKELLLPWNNWHSFKSRAGYLEKTNSNRWLVVDSAAFANAGVLTGAETLETDSILPSVTQFNRRRVEALLLRGPDGKPKQDNEGRQTVTEGKRLLRSLFETTEYNIASSENLSGLHPFPATGSGPVTPIEVPPTFFLNVHLLTGGTLAGYEGLGLTEPQAFTRLAELQPAEYLQLATSSGIKLGNLGSPSDANFAWFVPEPSHVDIDMVDRLLRMGVLSREFVAAVQLVDLRTPLFSKDRADLLRFIPATFKFKPASSGSTDAHPTPLTRQVIQQVRSSNPAANSPAARFLQALESPDPLKLLRDAVVAYHQELKAKLTDPARRADELKRLHTQMITLRKTVVVHPVLGRLVESELLFPLN